MSTRKLSSILARVAVAATCLIFSASCGSEMLRTGRSPVMLVVSDIEASSGSADGASTFTAFLLSDVQTLVDVTVGGTTTKVAQVFNDNARVTLRVESKNTTAPTTALNDVTVTRYHVEFRRTDGRNQPGVDVPYAFDGGLSRTIPVGGSADVVFELVRHQAKLEPPLANMIGFGGLGFLSAIAEVTIYGRDQNGNEMTAKASIDVHFGDFGDQ